MISTMDLSILNEPEYHIYLLNVLIKQLESYECHVHDKKFLADDIEGYRMLLDYSQETFEKFMKFKNQLRDHRPRRPSNKLIVGIILEEIIFSRV